MKSDKIFLYLSAFLASAGIVSAASFSLNYILRPFSSVNVGAFYLRYAAFIDAVIYLVLFLSLAKMVFTKVYSTSYSNSGKESKMVAVAVALVLTVSMTVLEMRTGFYIGQLYPVALIVLLAVIATLLYNLLLGLFTGESGKSVSASITFLLIYGLLIVPFGVLYKWIESNVPLLSSVIALGAVVAFINLLIKMFGLLSGGKSNNSDGSTTRYTDDGTNKIGGGGDDKIPKTPDPNTINILTPKTEGYAAGDVINVTFDTSGPGFSDRYDYDIYVNAISPHGRRAKVSGHHIIDPIPLTMGDPPSRVGVSNTIQVTAYSRGGFFGGGSNRIIAQAQVTFPIAAPGGGGGGGPTPPSGGHRPPGRRPPATHIGGHPGDPPTDPGRVPPGIIPGPDPNVPVEPAGPEIPDDKEILIDLSNQFNQVRSQGSLGACAAFATTALFEYETRSNVLSPLYHYYKIRELQQTVNSDSGSNPNVVAQSLIANGVCFEPIWPYDISKFRDTPPAAADVDAAQKKVETIHRVARGDPDQWVYALSNNHPLYIGINCPNDLGATVFYHNMSPHTSGGHAMVIVGYHSHYPVKDASGKMVGVKAFKIRNSWGVRWCENGHVWVSAETLRTLLHNDPIILKGRKSDSATLNASITGRVVYDHFHGKILSDRNGKSIFSDDNWPNPDPTTEYFKSDPYYVGAFAQINGKLVNMGREVKIEDPHGRFTLQFSCTPSQFEKLTILPQVSPRDFQGIDFSKLPAGIVVYKRHGDNSKDHDMYFHIVPFQHSMGGRGGEGQQNPDNPRSDTIHEGLKSSGIPITFSSNHNQENYVIVPVFEKSPAEEEAEKQEEKKVVDDTKEIIDNFHVKEELLKAVFDTYNVFLKSLKRKDEDMKVLRKHLQNMENILNDMRLPEGSAAVQDIRLLKEMTTKEQIAEFIKGSKDKFLVDVRDGVLNYLRISLMTEIKNLEAMRNRRRKPEKKEIVQKYMDVYKQMLQVVSMMSQNKRTYKADVAAAALHTLGESVHLLDESDKILANLKNNQIRMLLNEIISLGKFLNGFKEVAAG